MPCFQIGLSPKASQFLSVLHRISSVFFPQQSTRTCETRSSLHCLVLHVLVWLKKFKKKNKSSFSATHSSLRNCSFLLFILTFLLPNSLTGLCLYIHVQVYLQFPSSFLYHQFHLLSAQFSASLWDVFSGFVLCYGSQWCCIQHSRADIGVSHSTNCCSTIKLNEIEKRRSS